MPSIKRIFVRRYRDNGDTVAYVEWANGSRTEGRPAMFSRRRQLYCFTFGTHMHALFERAKRDGLHLERETW